MTARLPFNKRDRRAMVQHGGLFPYRMTNNWGEGDLPAPYAEGDIVEVAPGAKALERLYGGPPGFYVVTYGPSIDEGDAFYFRLHNGDDRQRSDRLHVAYASRSTFTEDLDWMAGVTLVDTLDPDGLALRESMIADGWQPTLSESTLTELAIAKLVNAARDVVSPRQRGDGPVEDLRAALREWDER